MRAIILQRTKWIAFLLLSAPAPWSAGAGDSPDGKAVVAASGSIFTPVDGQAGNAALFVGINEFTKDSSLTPLNFAVNDAIAMAHLFCIELQIVPPQRTVLALAGKPDPKINATIIDQRNALEKAGVRIIPATRTEILSALLDVVAMPQDEKDLLVVFMSTHGFEDRGIPYVMPSDGVKRILIETGLNLASMEALISDRDQGTRAGKKLLILDACREKAMVGSRGDIPMGPKFLEELGKAKGQAVLASCAMNQLSFEDPRLRHGVFVNYLLEGLRGKAATDPNGFIRLEQLLGFVKTEVAKWARSNNKMLQEPSFKGAESAREIPLAVDVKKAAAHAEAERRQSENVARLVSRLNEMRALHRQAISAQRLEQGEFLLESAEATLSALQRELRQVFLDLVEGRLTAAYLESALTAIEARHTPRVSPAPPEDPVARFKEFEQKRIMKLVEAEKLEEAMRLVTLYEESFKSDDFSRRLKDLLSSRFIPGKPERPKVGDSITSANDKSLTLDLGGGVQMELVLIPSGSFLMGSPDGELERDSDEKQHRVEITKPFYMGKFEVTNAQYRRFKPDHDSGVDDGVGLNDDHQPSGNTAQGSLAQGERRVRIDELAVEIDRRVRHGAHRMVDPHVFRAGAGESLRLFTVFDQWRKRVGQ